MDYIICSENCVDIYNPKVVQATMGSISRVKTYTTNLLVFLSKLPTEAKVYGSLLMGENIYETELASSAYLIIGSESHGIAKELKKYITDKITIPTFSATRTGAESLNASLATAIICSEFRRQSKF
jgi:TrmH family RNA methyltransferase